MSINNKKGETLLHNSGFSLTPYLESFTPTFDLGPPIFSENFFKFTLWDSYFFQATMSVSCSAHYLCDLHIAVVAGVFFFFVTTAHLSFLRKPKLLFVINQVLQIRRVTGIISHISP